MVFNMCYSKTYRDGSSYWNGFPRTLLLVLLVLCTCPSFLVDGSIMHEAKDVVNDFYNRYNVTDQNDLVFILDRSSSISRTAWISMINFVKNLLDHFLVDRDHVRVALVTFSSNTAVELDDLEPGPASDNSTKCTVYRRLRQLIDSVPLSGHAATYHALAEAYQVLLNSRPNAKKAVFLLTDSPSNIGDPPRKMAVRIQSLSWSQSWNSSLFGPQVEIYSVGVAGASVDELRSIASDLDHHFLHFPDFSTFDLFTRTLREDQVLEQWIDADSDSCGQTCGQESTKCMCGTKTGRFSCACEPGYESDGLRCKACQWGYYKEGYVPEPCKPCPQNKTTSTTGASNSTDCHPLPGQQRCPELPDIQNGFKFFVSGDQLEEVANTGLDCKDVGDGNSCHYECEDGFRLFNGTKVMKCNAWGEWEGTVPYCKMIDCEPMSEFWANKSRFALTYANDTTTYKSVVFASCWPGLVALGQTTWTCRKNGIWSRPWNFECKEVFCSPLMPVEFSEVVPQVCANETQRLGFECQMICGDGFRQIGPGNYTCTFEGRTFWKPRAGEEEGKPFCRDIQAPVITCPDDITVELDSDFDNCSTVVDYDREAPTIYDNSGNATYRIIGERANKTFCLGQALLTYEATDKTGNRGTCKRLVIVKEKSGKVISCPEDILLLANSSDRSHVVFWPSPIFHGPQGDPLPFNCTHTNGTEFKLGATLVVCAPTVAYQGSNCNFKVTISDPPCPMPFPDRIPVNGNTTCGQQTSFVKSCSTKCHDGFDMLDAAAPNIFCFWNGSWNLQQPWPECYRSRRPNNAVTDNRIVVTLNSSCTEQKRQKVIGAFIRKVDEILKDQQSPCKPPYECSIRVVTLNCSSSSRSRRSESSTDVPTSEPVTTEESVTLSPESYGGNFTLRVVLGGVVIPVNRSVILKSDQHQLYYVLGDVFFRLKDMVSGGQFFWQADDLLVTAVEMVEDRIDFVDQNCASDELIKKEEDAFACFVCPVGTYYVNGSNNESAACVPCPLGFYKDQEGGQQCRPCGLDRNTTSLGARNASECLDPCSPGYSSSTGYEPCSKCVQGTYQTESKSTACLRCPQNQTTQSNGATSLDDCFETIPCIDHNRTCGPHGSCILKKGHFSCLCDAGFAGAECNTDIDECENSHCQNQGTCIDQVAGYKCQCPSSFTGERCEIEVDECASLPCRHGGSCIDGRVSYTCVCLPGFTGSNCQEDSDECASNPCDNGRCLDGNNSFTCSCHAGYTGDPCDKQIDFCINETCFNGGRCIGSPSGTSCVCAKGFTGLKCETEINACASNPCLNEGFCSKEVDTFHCKCPPGFIGETCSLAVSSDFDLVFPEPSVSNYVMMRLRLNGSTFLRQVSVCTWMRTTDTRNSGTAWSYSVESNWLTADSANVLTAFDYGNLQFFVNGHGVATNLSLNDGTWHLLCFTWNGETGDWSVYINGTHRCSGHDLAKGTYINANGYLVLGQEQDSIGGGFDIQDSFVGELSQFAIFDSALDRAAISDMASVGSEQCNAIRGNVVSWTSVLDNIKGNVTKRNTSWCKDVNECHFASSNVCTGNTRCQDIKGSFVCVPCKASECPNRRDESPQLCVTNPCQNGGTCQPGVADYQCQCAPGYTGRHCADAAINISCDPNPCQNDGSCKSSGGEARCWCVEPWIGRYCQVRYKQPTCDAQPCYNNGTCFPNATHGYHCKCPAFSHSLSPDCEYLTVCASSKPCKSGGICVTVSSPPGYQCDCKPNFIGRNCEVDVTALCLNVDCKNGGTCVVVNGKYECKCHRDYKGVYCDVLRNKEVKAYHSIVKLDEEYNDRLQYNETFKDTFRQQIYELYASKLGSGRLQVKFNSIRKGSVVVDFDLTHSYYLDETNPGAEVMKRTLEEELAKFKLGTFKATPEEFVFVTKEDVSTSSSALIASVIVIVIIFVAVAITVLVWWYIKRYLPVRKMRNKLSNPMRVSNPMYQGDFSLSSPSPCNIQEDLYCEPRELLPYATSEDSDKDSDPGASSQNKRKKNNWHLRQSIPLPPKPDEAQASSFCSGRSIDEMNRVTPPPPYYPSHGHGPNHPPIPPARDPQRNPTPTSTRHNYVNEPSLAADSMYFMPLSDEEAELIKHPEPVSDNPAFESESAYLIPRQPAEEQDNTEAIEMTYLEPVRDTLATSDKAEAASTTVGDADKHNDSNVMYAIRSPSCDAPVTDDVTGTARQQKD